MLEYDKAQLPVKSEIQPVELGWMNEWDHGDHYKNLVETSLQKYAEKRSLDGYEINRKEGKLIRVDLFIN